MRENLGILSPCSTVQIENVVFHIHILRVNLLIIVHIVVNLTLTKIRVNIYYARIRNVYLKAARVIRLNL